MQVAKINSRRAIWQVRSKQLEMTHDYPGQRWMEVKEALRVIPNIKSILIRHFPRLVLQQRSPFQRRDLLRRELAAYGSNVSKAWDAVFKKGAEVIGVIGYFIPGSAQFGLPSDAPCLFSFMYKRIPIIFLVIAPSSWLYPR